MEQGEIRRKEKVQSAQLEKDISVREVLTR